MSAARSIVGAALGAAAAGLALRVRHIAQERETGIGEVLADLPGIVAEDATRITDAARHALEDGKSAARIARIDFDEQVAAHARRMGEHDD